METASGESVATVKAATWIGSVDQPSTPGFASEIEAGPMREPEQDRCDDDGGRGRLQPGGQSRLKACAEEKFLAQAGFDRHPDPGSEDPGRNGRRRQVQAGNLLQRRTDDGEQGEHQGAEHDQRQPEAAPAEAAVEQGTHGAAQSDDDRNRDSDVDRQFVGEDRKLLRWAGRDRFPDRAEPDADQQDGIEDEIEEEPEALTLAGSRPEPAARPFFE